MDLPNSPNLRIPPASSTRKNIQTNLVPDPTPPLTPTKQVPVKIKNKKSPGKVSNFFEFPYQFGFWDGNAMKLYIEVGKGYFRPSWKIMGQKLEYLIEANIDFSSKWSKEILSDIIFNQFTYDL